MCVSVVHISRARPLCMCWSTVVPFVQALTRARSEMDAQVTALQTEHSAALSALTRQHDDALRTAEDELRELQVAS